MIMNNVVYKPNESIYIYNFMSSGFRCYQPLSLKHGNDRLSELDHSISFQCCRDQTEEWKGWMQVMFVWYHYFAAKEWYNWIRVFIACYVWMTGFGQLLYQFCSSSVVQ